MGNWWSCMKEAMSAICGEEETNVVSSAPERANEPPTVGVVEAKQIPVESPVASTSMSQKGINSICSEEETNVVSSAPERATDPPTVGVVEADLQIKQKPPTVGVVEADLKTKHNPAESPLASTSMPQNRYVGKHVFLSHGGVQKNFVRQLYKDLKGEGVSCFFDESSKSLPLGEEWAPLIFKEADTCRVAVLLLSMDFIQSRWPMLELSAFVKAKKCNSNLKILPLFFNISPRDIKDLTSNRQYILNWTSVEISEERRTEWKEALTEVRKIKGLEFKEGGNEVSFREKIIKAVRNLLPLSGSGLAKGQEKVTLPLALPTYPAWAVGIEEQETKVRNLLNMNAEDESPQAVVIYGLGGIGKTTLANAVVSKLDREKYNYSTVEMDEESAKNDLKSMQQHILKDAFPNYNSGKEINLRDCRDGQHHLGEVFRRQGNKPVFIFIDNVLRKKDMEDLLPEDLESLPKRSRMLLTTRNLKETDFCEERGLKPIPHLVATLPHDQAVQILCKDAAKRELIKDNDVKRILQICSGIPLVLKIVGSYLRKMEYKVEKCTQILQCLEQGNKIKVENLSERLIDSVYSQLEDFEQEAFLDICCFFNGRDRRQVEYIVGAEALGSLIDAALVTSFKSRKGKRNFREGTLLSEEWLTVHDVVRAKGRSMSKSTRIMDFQALREATVDQRKAEEIKGVWLDQDEHVLDDRQLNLMKNSLRILALGDNMSTNGGILMNFKELKYLQIGSANVFHRTPRAAMYFGPIFKEGVSIYKVGPFSLFGLSKTLTSMPQTSASPSSETQKLLPTLEEVMRSALNEQRQSMVLSAPKPVYPKIAVGIEEQVIEVINKLNLNSEDESPQAVVIYGVGGIGKTTLANAVVAQLDLEKYSYVTYEMDKKKNARTRFQEKILRAAFPNYEWGTDISIIDIKERQRMLSEAFQCEGNKPLFLFIDNVLRKKDMEDILPVALKSFPKRSRMLLTTRNLEETDFCEERGLKRIPHPVDTLRDDQAVKILCKNPANCELIKDNDVKRILQICSGMPLVLKIVGAYLRKMEYKVDKCTQILESLEQGNKNKEENLTERLIDSVYRESEDFAQESFLDICCFFNKWDRQEVEWIVGAEALGSLMDAGLVNTSVRTNSKMYRGGLVMGEELLAVDDVVCAKGRSMSKSTRIMDLQGLREATVDQRTVEASKGAWFEHGEHVLEETRDSLRIRTPRCGGFGTIMSMNLMKDSLRILALKDRITTNGEILMNLKELRYLQIDWVKYYGPIFKEGVSMRKEREDPYWRSLHYFRLQE